MIQIERALFTSARSGTKRGYQLVAAGAGLSSESRKELSSWCPAHGALLDAAAGAISVNFHRLESGDYCVSRSVNRPEEYSRRGGGLVETQLLIVSPDALAQFANNPFRVLQAAMAGGHLARAEDGAQLPPAEFPAAAKPVDALLLSRLIDTLGAIRLAALAGAAIEEEGFDLVVGRDPRRTIQGLVGLLPVPMRPEFTFTTGLKRSKQRRFHLQTLAERRPGRPARPTLDLTTKPQESDLEGWAAELHPLLVQRNFRGLTELVCKELVDSC